MNIPKLYPDEYIFGRRGRIRFFNHQPTILQTIEELRAWYDRNYNDVSLLEKGTSQIFILSKFSGQKLNYFLQHHTLLPFSHPFGDIVDRGENPNAALQRYLMRSSLRVHKKGAWFCPSCISQDIQNYGISYWRRSHQLLGVDWCFKHRCKLGGITKNTAFNFEPALAQSNNEVLSPPGPNCLDEAEPIVQRYVDIANMLLNRSNPLELSKITSLIELQFLTQQYIENAKSGHSLYEKIKGEIPAYWIERFLKIRKKSSSFDILDFKKLSINNGAAQDTEQYLIAFATLFNSSAVAIEQIEQLHKSDFFSNKPPKDLIPNPWWSEQILNRYSYYKGCHTNSLESKAMLM